MRSLLVQRVSFTLNYFSLDPFFIVLIATVWSLALLFGLSKTTLPWTQSNRRSRRSLIVVYEKSKTKF